MQIGWYGNPMKIVDKNGQGRVMQVILLLTIALGAAACGNTVFSGSRETSEERDEHGEGRGTDGPDDTTDRPMACETNPNPRQINEGEALICTDSSTDSAHELWCASDREPTKVFLFACGYVTWRGGTVSENFEIDDSGWFHAIGQDADSRYYVTNRDGIWKRDVLTTLAGHAESSPYLMVDRGGFAHVLYFEGVEHPSLVYTTNVSGSFVKSTLDTEAIDTSLSLSIDQLGVIHLVYQRLIDAISSTLVLRKLTDRAATWSNPLALGSGGPSSLRYDSMKVDGAGILRAVRGRGLANGMDELRIVKYQAPNYVEEDVRSIEVVASKILRDFTFGSDGVLHALFTSTGGLDIFYDADLAGTFDKAITLVAPTQVSPAVAEVSGRPIVCVASGALGVFQYATKAEGAFQSWTLSPANLIGTSNCYILVRGTAGRL